MENEVLNTLANNPAHFPFFLLLAIAVIVIMTITKAIAGIIAKSFTDQLQKRQGLLKFCVTVVQIILLTSVIYIANAVYWENNVKEILSEAGVSDGSFMPWTTDIVIPPNQTATISRAWGKYVRITSLYGGYLQADMSTWPSNGLIDIRTDIIMGTNYFAWGKGLSLQNDYFSNMPSYYRPRVDGLTNTTWWRRSESSNALEAYRWEWR